MFDLLSAVGGFIFSVFLILSLVIRAYVVSEFKVFSVTQAYKVLNNALTIPMTDLTADRIGNTDIKKIEFMYQTSDIKKNY